MRHQEIQSFEYNFYYERLNIDPCSYQFWRVKGSGVTGLCRSYNKNLFPSAFKITFLRTNQNWLRAETITFFYLPCIFDGCLWQLVRGRKELSFHLEIVYTCSHVIYFTLIIARNRNLCKVKDWQLWIYLSWKYVTYPLQILQILWSNVCGNLRISHQNKSNTNHVRFM